MEKVHNKTDKTRLFPEEVRQKLDKWTAKFPEDQRQSASLAGLHIVQEYNGGHLTNDLMERLATYLDMPSIAVYEVATFYGMYEHAPVGRHKLNICTNIACMLNGSREIIAHIENRLGIRMGETTPDGRFTLRHVECQGACCGAPMLEVDKQFYENLTIEKVDKLLTELK